MDTDISLALGISLVDGLLNGRKRLKSGETGSGRCRDAFNWLGSNSTTSVSQMQIDSREKVAGQLIAIFNLMQTIDINEAVGSHGLEVSIDLHPFAFSHVP